MSNENIIRAWKDAEYRESLSEEQLSQLPENPAGTGELSDEDMEQVAGGAINPTKSYCAEYCPRYTTECTNQTRTIACAGL